MPFRTRRLLAAAAALMLCASGSAQGRSSWATLAPSGQVAPAAVRGQGKLVSYDAGATLHVFSSLTRRWHTVDKSPGATLKLCNDVALLIDGARCVAISSYDGHPRELTISSNATLWNGANANNDSIVLLVDGAELHAFSAFTGTWTSRALPAGATGSVQRHVAVVHSGDELWGMSAFDGQWRDIDCAPVTSLSTDGTAGFAVGAKLYAFSAHTRAWRQTTAIANASFARGDDWGLWLDAAGGVAYSGLLGAFQPFSLGNASVAASSDLFALLDDGAAVHAWSAVTGDLAPIGPSASAIDVGLGTALLHGAAGVRGYSALRQTAQLLPVTAGWSFAGSSVAGLTDTAGQTFAWSGVTASWHAAPVATVGRAPIATTTTLALETAADCYAFDDNTGQFVALGGPAAAVVGNPSSSPLLAYDAGSLHAFDADAGRWISTPRTSANPPTFRIWRTTALAIDGSSAHGIGAQVAAWSRHDLGPTAATAFANSEVAYLVDAQRIAACGMLAEIVALQQFPHFRRVQPRGAEVQFATTPLQDGLVLAGFAPPGAPTSLPGLGVLHLDLAAAVVLAPARDHVTGAASVGWSLPPSTALTGANVFAQLLVLPENAAPYLGDRATVQLW
ncbi:MAG: hypothetical protein KAI24_16555 [Planctomycetes bacterium]|nr:hypothetical protein [Planctomycetota bacterium]